MLVYRAGKKISYPTFHTLVRSWLVKVLTRSHYFRIGHYTTLMIKMKQIEVGWWNMKQQCKVLFCLLGQPVSWGKREHSKRYPNYMEYLNTRFWFKNDRDWRWKSLTRSCNQCLWVHVWPGKLQLTTTVFCFNLLQAVVKQIHDHSIDTPHFKSTYFCFFFKPTKIDLLT